MWARGLGLAGMLVLAACVNDPLWRTTPLPSASYVASVFAEDDHGLQEDDRPEDVPLVPVRRRLRPCCAFGSDIGVRVGMLAVPVFAIGNIRSPDDIGHVGDRFNWTLPGSHHSVQRENTDALG